jgi:SAM-dependent methyltransferase
MRGKAADLPDSRDIYARRRIQEIAARWDARADSWDQALEDSACHLNEDDAYRRFLRLVQRRITQSRAFCAAHGIIDLGCGTGLVLARVVGYFGWGIGVDLSPQMIRVARAKNLPNTTFLVGDGFKLPELCPKAGAVLSRGVLLSHYGPEQGQAILEAARAALLPGGFLACDFLNAAARTRQRHAPENKTWFTAGEIRAMARRAGFSNISCSGSPNRRVLVLLAEK